MLHPVQLLFNHDGEVRTFPGKDKLKQAIHTMPASQRILKEII
jgi:hypothetical protein